MWSFKWLMEGGRGEVVFEGRVASVFGLWLWWREVEMGREGYLGDRDDEIE